MARKNRQDRERKIYEWQIGNISNIGVTSTMPYDIIFNHIKDANLFDIIDKFFDNTTTKIHLLDQCILEQFWWIDGDIKSARYIKIEHPDHYSGEYIFDKENGERTIIEVRQPDIDGKHWKAEHLHIKRGAIVPENPHKITEPTFNKHIEIAQGKISGVFIMRISHDAE